MPSIGDGSNPVPDLHANPTAPVSGWPAGHLGAGAFRVAARARAAAYSTGAADLVQGGAIG
jgi:hypothetical protein